MLFVEQEGVVLTAEDVVVLRTEVVAVPWTEDVMELAPAEVAIEKKMSFWFPSRHWR